MHLRLTDYDADIRFNHIGAFQRHPSNLYATAHHTTVSGSLQKNCVCNLNCGWPKRGGRQLVAPEGISVPSQIRNSRVFRKCSLASDKQ